MIHIEYFSWSTKLITAIVNEELQWQQISIKILSSINLKTKYFC